MTKKTKKGFVMFDGKALTFTAFYVYSKKDRLVFDILKPEKMQLYLIKPQVKELIEELTKLLEEIE